MPFVKNTTAKHVIKEIVNVSQSDNKSEFNQRVTDIIHAGIDKGIK